MLCGGTGSLYSDVVVLVVVQGGKGTSGLREWFKAVPMDGGVCRREIVATYKYKWLVQELCPRRGAPLDTPQRKVSVRH